jgi:ABC-type multidrug transport system ATPase subunit
MSAAIEFHGLALDAKGPALTGHVERGATLCVVGPAASGKSRMLRAIAGSERPARGKVRVAGSTVVAGIDGFAGRATPQTICRRLAGPLGATPMAEALTATRLWDCRQTSIAGLSDGRRAACELLPLLLRPGDVLVADGMLDRLDPWTIADVRAVLDARVRAGATLVLATNSLALAADCSYLLVLKNMATAFFGKIADLLKEAGPVRIEVETDNRPRVKALVDPVAVEVHETDFGVTMKVTDDQEVAVKLLLEGYGDVKLLAVRRPTLEQVLLERFGA